MLKIKSLSAHDGDCFLINFSGKDEKKYNILIDGGRGQKVIQQIQNELQIIENNNEKLDLIVLTHTDADHIYGILKIFEKNLIKPQQINKIIFNSREVLSKIFPIKGDKNDLLVVNSMITSKISFTQQESLYDYVGSLDIELNKEPVCCGIDNIQLNNAKLVILSPTYEELNKLSKDWSKELNIREKKLGENWYDYSKSVDFLRKKMFKEDSTVVNGSSISFVLEHENKKILMLADSHPSVIVKSIKEIYGETGVQIDLVKVSHHGSKYNTSNELLELIHCENYLISTKPENSHTFPSKEALSRIAYNNHENNRKTNFYFNYSKVYQKIFREEEIQKYNINCIEPKNKNGILEIDLWKITEN